MKRSTHSDRVTAWARKQDNSKYTSKNTISADVLLRHEALLKSESVSHDEARKI